MLLAFDMVTTGALVIAGVAVVLLVLKFFENWATNHNHKELAEKLKTYEEGLVVTRETVKLMLAGSSPREAFDSVSKSPEAQDLLKKFKVFAHLSIFLIAIGLALASGCSGRITPDEDTEIQHNAAAGDGVLQRWDKTDDATKKAYVFSFTRTCYDELNTLHGNTIPPAYVVTPAPDPGSAGK